MDLLKVGMSNVMTTILSSKLGLAALVAVSSVTVATAGYVGYNYVTSNNQKEERQEIQVSENTGSGNELSAINPTTQSTPTASVESTPEPTDTTTPEPTQTPTPTATTTVQATLTYPAGQPLSYNSTDPDELAVSARRNSASLSLSWTDCKSNNVSYYVLYKSVDGTNFFEVARGGNLKSYVDTNVEAGRTYTYLACTKENDGSLWCGNKRQVSY
jgi:hypothetical protein